MVQALGNAGLRTTMDVVYNHTNARGRTGTRCSIGSSPATSTAWTRTGTWRTPAVANTASEHEMMEKLLIDSVLTWARQYKVDGFRFDLMGHHMKRNMVKLRAALDALTPARDVDGKKICCGRS